MGGVLFNWREQLSPRVMGGQTVAFERWLGDGTFASPREQLEWIPQGQVLVYKVAAVEHCPDIVQFASGRNRESFAMYLPAGLHPFLLRIAEDCSHLLLRPRQLENRIKKSPSLPLQVCVCFPSVT